MISPVKIWRNQRKLRDLTGRTGTICSWTIIRVPPSRFSSFAPYPVVLVEMKGGGRIMCQLVDYKPEDLREGTPVRVVIRRVIEPNIDAVIPYGIKVTPV